MKIETVKLKKDGHSATVNACDKDQWLKDGWKAEGSPAKKAQAKPAISKAKIKAAPRGK